MISLLRGRLQKYDESFVIIDVNGVGYEVTIPSTDIEMFKDGMEAVLYTHLSVRDDKFNLYGFSTIEARQMFRMLTEVSGVGPKAAMNLLSAFSTLELLDTLSEGRQDALQRVSGIGKKTAARLCVDLKEKASRLRTKKSGDYHTGTVVNKKSDRGTVSKDVASALMNLGYRPAEAEKAMAEAAVMMSEKDLDDFEIFFKTTLKILAR